MALNRNQKKYLHFSFIFIGVFLVTFVVLYVLGLVPEELLPNGNSPADALKLSLLENSSTNNNQVSTPAPEDVPVKIEIPKASVNISVSDPNTTDNAILNEYLLKGAVRYPGGGYLGNGNLFLFGHSSMLEKVHNQAYRAFNGIENLKSGDEIYVYSTSTKYIYKVRDERLVQADKEQVDLTSKTNMLTLSTCDLLGSTKEDRYVVRADYAGKENI